MQNSSSQLLTKRQRPAHSPATMALGNHPSIEDLHSELIACILAHISFNKQKIQLKAVCSIWRDALQLPAAHPPKSFESCIFEWPEDIVADYELLGGPERVSSLYVTSSYFREVHTGLSLTNLRSLDLEAEDDHGTVHLPYMPNLQRLTLTTADQSGHQMLQTGLLKLAQMTALHYTSECEEDEDIPIICAPLHCAVEISMMHACLRLIPTATSHNLTKLSISLDSDVFPDLRNCERLTHIQFWLDQVYAPGPHPIYVRGMGNLPSKVAFVKLVAPDVAISVEDHRGYCQFRAEHSNLGWCTYILDMDKLAGVNVVELDSLTELIDF